MSTNTLQLLPDSWLQNGKTLSMRLKSARIDNISNNVVHNQDSAEYSIFGLMKFRVKNVMVSVYNGNSYSTSSNQIISIKLVKLFETDDLIYTVELFSDILKLKNKVFFVTEKYIENASSQIIFENSTSPFRLEFDLKFTLDLSKYILNTCNIADNYDDEDNYDFELRGENGSVCVHKAVISLYSPVMKTMLSGKWKETIRGVVDIPNTTKETLQQLKDYIYTQAMPEAGDIKPLAKLASYYMMADLEERCVLKLLTSLTVENACELLEFAVHQKMEKLLISILEQIQQGRISVRGIIKAFCMDKQKNDVQE